MRIVSFIKTMSAIQSKSMKIFVWYRRCHTRSSLHEI